MVQRNILLALVVLVSALAWPSPAAAHGMRTGTLRVDETDAARALVRWSTTVPGGGAEPVLPLDCTATPLDDATGDDVRVFALECPGGLAGHTFGARGLGRIVTDATVFVQRRDGSTASGVLTPEAPSWRVPSTQGSLDVARSYVRAGLLHIASGADHLLFLALLVLLLRKVRAVLLAETAFTLSHTLAFTATSLGWIHVRSAPVEACIALSLVLLALDVKAAASTRSAWQGAAMALVFGLVHGLGFAGGLQEAGLPDAHAAIALAGFGLGVELGQVAFLGVVLVAVAVLSRARVFPRLVVGASTLAGGLAMAWLLERLVLAFRT